jgi:hypothetical protein
MSWIRNTVENGLKNDPCPETEAVECGVEAYLWRMASSYAFLTAFFSLGFLLCTSLHLSSSVSTPSGSSLSLENDLNVNNHTVRGAGDRCCQFRISTCTVFISESIVSPLLIPVTGARRRQQSLPAECGQLPCPCPSSNPGRGKDNFLVGCTLKQFQVLYDIKNKFVWMKSYFCC